MTRAASLICGLMAAGLVLSAAAPVWACRLRTSQPAVLAAYPAVAVASVERAERLPNPGFNRWRIEARERLPDGSAGPRQFVFEVANSSTGCGEATLPPQSELWAVWLDEDGQVADGWTLDLARSLDDRLASTPSIPAD